MFSRVAELLSDKRGLTVYFYPDTNQAPVCKEFMPGEMVRPPESITRKGYVIEGWFCSRKLTNSKSIDSLRFGLRRKFLKRISLYAKWKPANEK